MCLTNHTSVAQYIVQLYVRSIHTAQLQTCLSCLVSVWLVVYDWLGVFAATESGRDFTPIVTPTDPISDDDENDVPTSVSATGTATTGGTSDTKPALNAAFVKLPNATTVDQTVMDYQYASTSQPHSPNLQHCFPESYCSLFWALLLQGCK